ncbi:MAG: hypothetical protein SGPRY_003490 [Prymnesium sp.]
MAATREDLSQFLELPQCECLNASKEHPLAHAIGIEAREDPGSFLQSDCDEELMIHLKFMSAVKISALQIESPLREKAPSSMRLFINKARRAPPSPFERLTPLHVRCAEGLPTGLLDTNPLWSQNVTHLSIFIGANQGGGDETAISKLLILGDQVVQSGLKRTAEQQAASTKGDWLGGKSLG